MKKRHDDFIVPFCLLMKGIAIKFTFASLVKGRRKACGGGIHKTNI